MSLFTEIVRLFCLICCKIEGLGRFRFFVESETEGKVGEEESYRTSFSTYCNLNAIPSRYRCKYVSRMDLSNKTILVPES